jgi:hypothetical protein
MKSEIRAEFWKIRAIRCIRSICVLFLPRSISAAFYFGSWASQAVAYPVANRLVLGKVRSLRNA